MEKLTVRIWTGTLCYIMGGAGRHLLSDYLPESLPDKVEIRGATCLDFCNQEGKGKAPFVLVGDELVTGATVAKVVEAIKQKLG